MGTEYYLRRGINKTESAFVGEGEENEWGHNTQKRHNKRRMYISLNVLKKSGIKKIKSVLHMFVCVNHDCFFLLKLKYNNKLKLKSARKGKNKI